MPTRYEIYLCRDTGERLVLLSEYMELQYQIVQQEAGFCHIVVPGDFDPSYIRPDNKIAVWRQPDGGSLALEDVYLIRYYRRFTTAGGAHRFEIVGANGNSILVDRVVDYLATTYEPWLSLTDHADDAMKLIVTDNASGTHTSSTPRINPTYFSVEAQTSQGQSFAELIGFRTLADVCTSLCTKSNSLGTDILWHVVALSETQYQFRTYVNQIGQNRTWPDGYNPILVSEENGTMAEPVYTWDGIEARNVIAAIGVDFDEANRRQTSYCVDKLLGAYNKISVYSHRSSILDCGQVLGSIAINMGLAELIDSQPKETFAFKLQDTEDQKYGRDWKFGDKITAFYADKYYTCRIRGVTVEKSSSTEVESITVDMDIIPVTAPEVS